MVDDPLLLAPPRGRPGPQLELHQECKTGGEGAYNQAHDGLVDLSYVPRD